jgi:hypothetical protein
MIRPGKVRLKFECAETGVLELDNAVANPLLDRPEGNESLHRFAG